MKQKKTPEEPAEILIEKNIKPPAVWHGYYPWASMEVGDSFFIPETDKKVASVAGAACSAGKKTGKKFMVRKRPGGCRVWRVK